MNQYSRRNFIKRLGAAAAGLALAGQTAFAKPFSDDAETANENAFNFLVVGDSLIWGQGLRQENKFYQLTKDWLETEVFKNARRVKVKVKAHSGASINLRPAEADELQKAEIGEVEFYHPEVNLSFPSIRAQIDVARKEYKNAQPVDLIMLTGGITDIRLTTILNPLKDNDELRRAIAEHCNEKMFALLEHAAVNFPNALIVVVGYYPFLSRYTPKRTILNNLLEMYEVAPPLKAVINNPLNRQLFKRYRRKMIERSMIWAENSALEYQKAVDRVNAKFAAPRVVFVKSPITEENSMGTKKALLYEVGGDGKAADALAADRKEICAETLDKLRELTDLKFRTRTCELATVGHPNVAGSKAIAEAIQQRLKTFFPAADEAAKVSNL